MSPHLSQEQQDYSATGSDPEPSRQGSKRASPLNDFGFRDEARKRARFENGYDLDNPEYLSNSRSLGSGHLSPSTVETSPRGHPSSLTPNWCGQSPTSSQSAYDAVGSLEQGLYEDSGSRRTDAEGIAPAGRGSSHQALPSIEITDAGSSHEFSQDLLLAVISSGYQSNVAQDFGDALIDDLTPCVLDENWVNNGVSDNASEQISFIEHDRCDNLSPITAPKLETGEVIGNKKLMNELSADFPHDTCFGVILLPFKSSTKLKLTDVETSVEMIALGDMLKLSVSDSNKYAGILEAAALRTLLQNPRVALKGMLSTAKRADKTSKQDSKGSAARQFSDCLLRVSIYGAQSEKQSVGALLSEAALFLQHPTAEEVSLLKYDNPHFLIRPGSDMPSLEQLSIMSDPKPDETPDALDESSISLVMRVFDSESVVKGTMTTEVSDRIRTSLEDHQRVALAMMQEKECGVLENTKFPSLWQSFTDSNGTKKFRNTVTGTLGTNPKPFYGGILADEMGLGKTLSVLALICWSLDVRAGHGSMESSETTGITLVVAPKSTINGWKDQIEEHVKPDCIDYIIFHGNSRALHSTSEECNVVLTTYETLRMDWSNKRLLYSEKWDRIILDEAHHVRSATSRTFKAVCELRALNRWCLSGTPICNSLTDYASLLTFIGVRPFADRKAFKSWILDPIRDKRPTGLKRLESLVRATCLRRKKSHKNLGLALPAKSERVHWIDLSTDDEAMYKFFKLKTARLAVDLSLQRTGSRRSSEKGDLNIVTLLNVLRRVCDHGEYLLPPSALDIWNHTSSNSPTQQQNLLVICDWCEQRFYPEASDGLACEHIICATCTASNDLQHHNEDIQCPKCANGSSSDSELPFAEKSGTNIRPCAKVQALIQNLKLEQGLGSITYSVNIPAKSLVFSIWTKMLDLLQHHLHKSGFQTARIDGSCSLQQRSQAIKRFTKDPSCTVMLASIGSAGEGIDLTAANNVHLIEPHWNPMQEAQAIDRVHRIGQQREVNIVRYLTRNSIETYVQWIQQEKIRLINQTLDSVHVSQAEIDEKRWQKLKQYIGSLKPGVE